MLFTLILLAKKIKCQIILTALLKSIGQLKKYI